jgi:hypothetical protein
VAAASTIGRSASLAPRCPAPLTLVRAGAAVECPARLDPKKSFIGWFPWQSGLMAIEIARKTGTIVTGNVTKTLSQTGAAESNTKASFATTFGAYPDSLRARAEAFPDSDRAS